MTTAHDELAARRAQRETDRIPGTTDLYLSADGTRIMKRRRDEEVEWLDWAPRLEAWWRGTQPHERVYRVTVGDTTSDIVSDEFRDGQCWEEFPDAAGHDSRAVREALAAVVKMQRREMPEAPGIHVLGWHDVDGTPIYVTPGESFGPEGPVNVNVRALDSEEAELPPAPEGPERTDAVRRSLSMLAVGRLGVTAPAMCSTWLAPLVTLFGADSPKFVPWMWSDGRAGVFGVLKSSFAALCQAHSGLGYSASDADMAPAAESTIPALSGLLGVRQDGMVWLDDYKPGESGSVSGQTQATMERAIRLATNRQRRLKSQKTGGRAHTVSCFAILSVTAECLPLFESGSTHDRVFAWRVDPGDVDKARLSELQANYHELPSATAAYVDWLARNHDGLPERLRARFHALRSELSETVTGRACSHIAHMIIAAETFTACAVDYGAMTEPERAELLARIREALVEVRRDTDSERAEDQPQEVWPELLRAALASGEAYVSGVSGARPDTHAESLGWGPGDFPRGRTHIGYAQSDGLYLIPAASQGAVLTMASRSGRTFGVTGKQLRSLLANAGVIVPRPANKHGKNEHLHNLRIGSQNAWCIRVPWDVFLGTGATDEPSEPDVSPCESRDSQRTHTKTPGQAYVSPVSPCESQKTLPIKTGASAEPASTTPAPHLSPAKTSTTSRESAQEATMVRAPRTDQPDTEKGLSPAVSPQTTDVSPVLAVGLTPSVAYLATANGIRTADPAADGAYADMGALLEWLSATMPDGGTVALDSDSPDLVGFPEVPQGSADYGREYGTDHVPAAVSAAAAAGWTASEKGVRTWTTWTPRERGRASITTVVLPWSLRRVQGASDHIMLDEVDDVGAAAMMLATWRDRLGSAYAYTSGSSIVMSLFREYRAPDGSTVTVRRRGREVPKSAPRFKTPATDGANANPAFRLSEGNLIWTDAEQLDRLDPGAPVVELDATMQHLSTMRSAMLARDGLGYVPRAPISKRHSGMVRIARADYRLPGGPYLAGPIEHGGNADEVWVPMETAALLLDLDLLPDAEYEAWVPLDRSGQISGGARLLYDVAGRVHTLITSIPDGTADAELGRVRDAGKRGYSAVAGQLRAETSPFVVRPDWGNTIVALSRANLLRRIIDIWRATGAWPLHITADAVYYAAPEPVTDTTDPAAVETWFTLDKRTRKLATAETPEADRTPRFPIDVSGLGLGTFDIEWSGTAQELRARIGRKER